MISADSAPLELPLARAAIDRAGHLRLDEEELSRLWERAQILHFASGKFRTISTDHPRSKEADGTPQSSKLSSRLELLTANKVEELIRSAEFSAGERFFLGIADEVPYFGWCGEAIDIEQFEQYQTLRELGADLSDIEIGLAVHAQALANWHHKHPRCPLCGEITKSMQGGSIRRCIADGSDHYPRTDAAIIVLIKDARDRILLGRQKVWPQFRFSTFAGFVEPGESFEQCVVREVAEEAGVEVTNIRYLGSQPWPFPASLMIAFEALAANPEAARPDGEEIEEVAWFTRAQLRSAIHRQELLLPPKISVARQMISAWYGPDAARDLSCGETWRS
ncbi:MAG: NAD(+) diphosphatase [Actinomycetes bacterium]